MAGLFSGFGRGGSDKQDQDGRKKSQQSSTPKRPINKNTDSRPPPATAASKASAASTALNKKTLARKAENQAKSPPPEQKTVKKPQTNTGKPQESEQRSADMRLSKNPPKTTDNDFDIPSDPLNNSASYTSSTTSIGNKVEPKLTPSASIGPKISFKGELSGEEDLLVQGHVEGTISLKNNHLTIGKHGTVKANILAKTITVEGKVEGDIVGEDKVEIKATSQVNGNLKAERVTLEDGAKFRGSIDMGSTAAAKPSSETTHTMKPTSSGANTSASSSSSAASSSSSSDGNKTEDKADTV